MTARTTKIGLGTVQWGVNYGIANREGMPASKEVGRIMSAARAQGVTVVDTASLYGAAEEVLGQQELSEFRVVTKTPRYSRDLITASDADDLVKVFKRSLDRLRVPSVYGLLAHHANDLFSRGGENLIDAMWRLKRSGYVRRIGVSVYDGRQVDALLKRFTPDIVQLPVNVLDQRLICDGTLPKLQALGVEVHARSAFLQGLLLMPPNELPEYFMPWRKQLENWNAACVDQGILPLHAALSFVCDIAAVNCCVIGVQTKIQFDECVRDLDMLPRFDATGMASSDPARLNPSNWRLS